MQEQFFGLRGRAANIGSSLGNYSLEDFQTDFPQFFNSHGESLLPETMLMEIISMANASIQPDKWLESWRMAVGLYVAHYTTLYLRSYAPSNESGASAASSGALTGIVKSATLGDSSVTYDTSAVTKGTEEWGDLNTTTYGMLLASKAKLIGAAGTLVI